MYINKINILERSMKFSEFLKESVALNIDISLEEKLKSVNITIKNIIVDDDVPHYNAILIRKTDSRNDFEYSIYYKILENDSYEYDGLYAISESNEELAEKMKSDLPNKINSRSDFIQVLRNIVELLSEEI